MEEALGHLMRARSGSARAAARLMAVLLFVWGGLAVVQGQSAPIVQSYLYLEPFDARVEVLMDLPSMLERLGKPHDPWRQPSGDGKPCRA